MLINKHDAAGRRWPRRERLGRGNHKTVFPVNELWLMAGQGVFKRFNNGNGTAIHLNFWLELIFNVSLLSWFC